MFDKTLKAIPLLGLVASLVIGPSAMASPYTKLVVFGDTLTDVGNYYRANPSTPLPSSTRQNPNGGSTPQYQ